MGLTEKADVVFYYNYFILIKIKDLQILPETHEQFNSDFKNKYVNKYFITMS